MAGLRAPVSVAAWASIALAVIVCLGQSVEAARDLKEILKHGIKASAEHRTDDEWKKLGKAALEEIQKRGGKVSDDVKEWLQKLTGVSRDTDCSDEVVANLVSWRSVDKKFKKFHAVLDDYLKLYLGECGLEERFKAAVDKLKQDAPAYWSSGKYKTLRKYLKSGDWSVSEAKELLSVVNDILELDSKTGKTNCTDEYMIPLVMQRIRLARGDIFLFQEGYSALYLKKCGFDDDFKKVIGVLKQISPERWRTYPHETMYGWFKAKNWFRDGVEGFYNFRKIFSLIKNISQFDNNPGETDCSAEHMIDVVKASLRARGSKNDDFLRARLDYGKIYLEKCGYEKPFKQAIDKLKQISPEYWSLEGYETMWGHLESSHWSFCGEMDLMSVVSDVNKIDSINEETDCTDERMITVVMKKSHAINGKFMDDYGELYSRKCGFEDLFKKAIENVESVSSKRWQSAMFPSLIGYLRLANSRLAQDGLLRLLPAIREISKPESITGDIDCSEKRVAQVSDWFVKCPFNHILYDFLSGYHEFYQEKCKH